VLKEGNVIIDVFICVIIDEIIDESTAVIT